MRATCSRGSLVCDTRESVAASDAFRCLNCGTSSATGVYDRVPDRFQGFAGNFNYVRCDNCGLVQLEHVPENPGEFYENYRMHEKESRVYTALRRLLVGHCYYQVPGHGKRMLDIGCGNGSYIREMAKLGWDASGYEWDPAYAAELSRVLGLPVLAGEDALRANEGQFDLITFNFSFEHLDNPLPFLELVTRCLRPGGEIYLAVPNIEGREASLFRQHWFHLDAPRHITFFTKQHLRDLLGGVGFTDIVVKDLPVPTGFAGSLSFRLWNRFQTLTWYAGMLPGIVFSRVVPDGNFAIRARRAA